MTFEIKSSIESKDSSTLFLNRTLRRQLVSEYANSTLDISLIYLFAFMSRSNLKPVKSGETGGLQPPPRILANVDLWPIDNNSEK